MTFRFSNDAGAFRQTTLYQLRWVAIIGQMVTILIAFLVGLEFQILACVFVVILWALLNIAQQWRFAPEKRLKTRQSFWSLGADLIELTVILALTGGLNNPFVTLLIVPAILGAISLSDRFLLVLIAMTIIAVIFLSQYFSPVYYQSDPLLLPQLISIGVAVSLIVLIIFLSYFARQITKDNQKVQNALAAAELALQREHRLSSLGALVAAYAHELGTPLATIRLTSADLLEQKLSKTAREDVKIIQAEAKRSVEILSSMGKRGKADALVNHVALRALIEEAAAPHLERGKTVRFLFCDNPLLMVKRSEAIIQGVRNLVQNAVDFAEQDVLIELEETEKTVIVRIEDDGPGFPIETLNQFGEPYLRSQNSNKRENYQGMGLGIFISKTLLERTGARVFFNNIRERDGGGASVTIRWSHADIEIDNQTLRKALGENEVITS